MDERNGVQDRRRESTRGSEATSTGNACSKCAVVRRMRITALLLAAGGFGWLLWTASEERVAHGAVVAVRNTTAPPWEKTAAPIDPVEHRAGDTTRGQSRGALAEGAIRTLRVPIDGADPETFRGSFDERRGARRHDAIDIAAPRGTAVLAVDDGVVAKLFTSAAGGLTVYQFDPTGTRCYYYAHLDAYADGLREGQTIRRGDLLGRVGTTGNAPANAPHLHFAVHRLGADRAWWKGTPIDPYPMFRD